MRSPYLGTYDPKMVNTIVGTVPMTGWTKIKVARNKPENYELHMGTQGEGSRTKNNDRSGTYTITFKNTSPCLRIMDRLKETGQTFPVMVQNISNSQYLAQSEIAWVKNDPDDEFSAEEGEVEYIIESHEIQKTRL